MAGRPAGCHVRSGDIDGVTMQNWSEKRVLIIGAARQGQALARYLAAKGACVTINDRQTSDQLKQVMESFRDTPLHWVTGGHPVDLIETTDMVCLSGGIPLNIPIVTEALRRGTPLCNDTQIFLEVVPCPVIGITGSAGKTTTTTLVGRMAAFEYTGDRKSWVGGNIGLPLISYLDEMKKDDLAILEISSFQLEQLTKSPQIAAVINITPNHLDRHGSMEAYTAAKARILQFQSSSDTAVLNRENDGSWGLNQHVHGRLVTFGEHRPDPSITGTFVENGKIFYQTPQGLDEIMTTSKILIRGRHNLINILAAAAIAKASGFSNAAIHAGVDGFKGVAHRLELVRELNGVRWYNDSIATAPERSMAAIHSFVEPIVLLAGGRDKNLPWNEFAELVHQRVKYLVTFGEAGPLIARAVETAIGKGQLQKIVECVHLEEAVQAASELAQSGDVVLLSPGGTSYDEFKDFEERGEVFRTWVQQLS